MGNYGWEPVLLSFSSPEGPRNKVLGYLFFWVFLVQLLQLTLLLHMFISTFQHVIIAKLFCTLGIVKNVSDCSDSKAQVTWLLSVSVFIACDTSRLEQQLTETALEQLLEQCRLPCAA